MKFYDLMHGCLTCVRITLIINKYWIIRNLFLPYTHKTSYSAGWHEHDTLLIGCCDRLKFSLYRGEYFTMVTRDVIIFFRNSMTYWTSNLLHNPTRNHYWLLYWFKVQFFFSVCFLYDMCVRCFLVKSSTMGPMTLRDKLYYSHVIYHRSYIIVCL